MAIQYAGGTNVNATFTGTKKYDIMKNVVAQLLTAGWTKVSGNAGQDFTVTIASPAVVTATAHGFAANDRVILFTTGALPTGLVVGTVYFIKAIDANTFNLAATSGGANINTTGSQSGTHSIMSEAVLMQTAATAQALSTNFRLKDNLGSCLQISMESTDGTKLGGNSTTAGANLLPAVAKTFRVIANKFQAFVMTANFTTAREFAAWGVPYIPAPNTVPANAGWLVCNSNSDSSATANDGWRTKLENGKGASGSMQVMWATSIWESGNNQQNNDNYATMLQLASGGQTVALLGGGGSMASGNPGLYRWASDDIISADALLSWGLTAIGDEPKIRGQLWDAIIIHDSISGDTTTSFDSHNWFTVTNSNVGVRGTGLRGCLMLVIP